MQRKSFSYKRPRLARALCDSLQGHGIANARSGLFLAGPRRVGKSTFLQEDLMPEAHDRAWVTVYVDLWSNRGADPAVLIAEAIKSQIARYEGVITRLARAAKVEKIAIMGTLVLDFKQTGLPPSLTLSDVLGLLHRLAGQPVMLVVDEAQHALESASGLDAMFALKSARDQLNGAEGEPALVLVFTGSNRDKLAHLVLKKDQPFFGSDITQFPLLERGFTDAFTVWVNQGLADDNQFTAEGMWAAFQLVGHRPEILRQLAGAVALSGGAGRFAELLVQDAALWHSRIWSEYEGEFNALTGLQQAVLETMVRKGRDWSPYTEESLAGYRQLSGQRVVSAASVQTAIQALRDKGLIWQAGRGAYALEDAGFAEWFRYARQTKR